VVLERQGACRLRHNAKGTSSKAQQCQKHKTYGVTERRVESSGHSITRFSLVLNGKQWQTELWIRRVGVSVCVCVCDLYF
jgi:glycerol-3-phosphate cytidylyltransferase-like family protein